MATYPQVKLFGTPALTYHGQPLTGFISNKAVAAVYFVAATAQPQARDLLATLLWTNSTDTYAKKNLRNVLSNLRNRLGEAILITRETVTLAPPLLASVDSVRFLQLFSAAEQALHATERHSLLADANALYHGPFLEGFQLTDADAFEEWLRAERQRYGLLAIQVLHELVKGSLQQSKTLEGINYATRLLQLDPLREETHRHLMRLLAMDGQASAALAQYRTCQALLRDELGTTPDLETEALHRRILSGEFRTASAWRGSVAATLSTAVAHPVTLPAEMTAFVGRTAEVASAQQRLTDPNCRLLTITGMGGIGKTRLAVHIGHRLTRRAGEAMIPFTDGIYFCPLAALEPNAQLEHQLPTTIAALLQLPLHGATAPAMQLAHALTERDLLLILDNCEHLPIVAFLNTLFQHTQHLKCLVTARARLNIQGEHLLPLSGLALPDDDAVMASKPVDETEAIRLFVQSVKAVQPDFRLDRHTSPLALQICRLLQGLPLGIELAASWTRLLSLPEIVQEIQQNLDFLNVAVDATTDQPQNLRAIFTQSWRLLSPAEQQALRRLAIFRGGFTRAAAAKVAGAALPLLVQLTDKSLVQRRDSGLDDQSNWPDSTAIRYELHLVIRQYAAEQLAAAGETDLCCQRHAAYVAEFLAARLPDLQSEHQQDALRLIHAEIENVRAAWQWLIDHLQSAEANLGQIEHQVSQGFDSLFHFYDMRSWFQEGEAIFAQLAQRLPTYSLPLAEGSTQLHALWRLQARAQARQGWFAFHLGRHREGRVALEQSLYNLRQLGAEAETVFNLNYLGALLRHRGDLTGAEAYLQTALTVAQNHDDRLGATIALNNLGQLAFMRGDYVQTQALCRQALAIKQALGDRWGMTYSLNALGRVAQATGDYDAAQNLFAESLAICRAIGDQRGAAMALQNLADTAFWSGKLALAQARYQESLRIHQAIGSRAEASLNLAKLGEIAGVEERYADAQEHLRAALSLAWSSQARPGLLAALLGLGTLALATGELAKAVTPLQLVYQHADGSHAEKRRAEQLLAQCHMAPTAPSPSLDLATYVQAQLYSALNQNGSWG